jgi:hypothetical protein
LYNRAINDFFFSHTSDGIEVFITHWWPRGRELLPEMNWIGRGEGKKVEDRESEIGRKGYG